MLRLQATFGSSVECYILEMLPIHVLCNSATILVLLYVVFYIYFEFINQLLQLMQPSCDVGRSTLHPISHEHGTIFLHVPSHTNITNLQNPCAGIFYYPLSFSPISFYGFYCFLCLFAQRQIEIEGSVTHTHCPSCLVL